VLHCKNAGSVATHDDIWSQKNQLARERRQPSHIAIRVSVHEVDVTTFPVAEVLHTLQKAIQIT
jgi:hypothetical protein